MNKLVNTLYVVVLSLALVPAAWAYVVGGPAANLQTQNGGYAWDGGANLQPFRGALQNPAYFGPGGVVEESISLRDMTGAEILDIQNQGVDGFIVPWWRQDESATYHAALVNFFLGGGDLWLLQDSGEGLIGPGFGRDGVGQALGVPTVGQTAITPVNGGAPLFDGPFGIANNVGQGGGEEGYLSAADVAAQNGTVVGTNTEGQVIAAVWGPDQYAPGAGNLIIVADIDMFTTQANFAPLDDNGIFTLNAFAFLATNEERFDVPEPATLALSLAGVVGLVGARRRRR